LTEEATVDHKDHYILIYPGVEEDTLCLKLLFSEVSLLNVSIAVDDYR